MALMDFEGAEELGRKLIGDNFDNLTNHDGLLLHLRASWKIAGEVVRSALKHYPQLAPVLKEEEVSLAAYLHDVGRPLRKDQLFHEPRGASYIREKGLLFGVADDQITVGRLAQMFMPHFIVYEQALLFPKQVSAEFDDLDPTLLMARNWAEMIVTYADMCNINGERVDVGKRMEDIATRYKEIHSSPNHLKLGVEKELKGFAD